MLKKMVEANVILWIMGAIIAIGVLGKIITVVTLRKLVKASSEMGKSTHKLMKLVKAKFEHTIMISEKVENIHAFVEKYIFEYCVCGLHLHTWRYLEKQSIWFCGVVGCVGAFLTYRFGGTPETIFQYTLLAGVGMVVLFLIYVSTDENHQMNTIQVYMVDYLQNICAPRYQKQQALQLKKMEEMMRTPEEINEDEEEKEEVKAEEPEQVLTEESVYQSDEVGEEKEEKKVPQEVILREILEEFLA
ncbi:hypothetical protein [Faecalimonas sp.]